MYKIVLQVGHMNASMGEAWLKPMTGAPEEEPKNRAITFRTAELLRERGFEVKVTDANGYLDKTIIIPNEWDLFLAIHCDADSAALSAGFTDYCDPQYDGATVKSQKYANDIADKFFPESGIVNRPERRGNINVRQYYFWDYISSLTPCVLIEMGESVDPHDKVILQDTERCAIALARGVCKAFDVPYDASTDCQKKLDSLSQQYEARLADKDRECQNKIAEMRQKIIDLVKNMT
jgi:N-acetylmuramoyl-L-alanine amidase